MHKMKSFAATALLVVLATVGLYACGGESPAPATATSIPPTDTVAVATDTAVPPTDTVAAPTDTAISAQPTSGAEQPTSGAGAVTAGPSSSDALDLLNKSAQTMKGLQSYHATFQVQTGDTNSTVDMDFSAPGSYRMNVTASGVSVSVIRVGSDVYVKTPGSDNYVLAPSGTAAAFGGTNPNAFLSSSQFAEGAQIVGDEQVGGVDTTHVRYSYDVTKVAAIMAEQAGQPTPAVTPGGATVVGTADVWIEKSTGYMRQIKTASQGVTSTTALVTFSNFNQPVNPPITVPSSTGGAAGTPTP